MHPHRWQPTRLPRPWDSPGKNTGVGCHFLLQYMNVKSESEVAQSYPTLSNPTDCSPLASSVHGIFQARVGVGCHVLLQVEANLNLTLGYAKNIFLCVFLVLLEHCFCKGTLVSILKPNIV